MRCNQVFIADDLGGEVQLNALPECGDLAQQRPVARRQRVDERTASKLCSSRQYGERRGCEVVTEFRSKEGVACSAFDDLAQTAFRE